MLEGSNRVACPPFLFFLTFFCCLLIVARRIKKKDVCLDSMQGDNVCVCGMFLLCRVLSTLTTSRKREGQEGRNVVLRHHDLFAFSYRLIFYYVCHILA